VKILGSGCVKVVLGSGIQRVCIVFRGGEIIYGDFLIESQPLKDGFTQLTKAL